MKYDFRPLCCCCCCGCCGGKSFCDWLSELFGEKKETPAPPPPPPPSPSYYPVPVPVYVPYMQVAQPGTRYVAVPALKMAIPAASGGSYMGAVGGMSPSAGAGSYAVAPMMLVRQARATANKTVLME